jgi:hypothetical protein
LTVRRGSADFDAMGAKETANRTVEEFAVEIASEPLGPAAGIHEESPEGIFDGGTGEVLESITPAVLGSKVNQHEAVAKAAGAGAVTVADVGANGVQGSLGALNGAATRAAFDCGEVTKRRRGFRVGSDVESSAEMWEEVVIQFTTAEHAFEIGGGVANDRGGSGFGDVLGRDDGFIKGKGRVGWLRERRSGGTSVGAAASDGILEEAATSSTTRLGGRFSARLVIIESNVGSAGRVGDDAVLVVIDGDGK